MVWRRRRARVEPDHVDLEHWVNGPVATAPSVLSEPTARTGASSYRSPWLGLPNVKPEVRRRAVPSGRSRVRATTPCRRPLRNHRPPLECARHRACARSAAPRRCRPFPCVLALGRCGLPRQPLSPLRSLQRAARHIVELLAGRLPHPRGVEGRRDATARERSPVDRCKAADLARRPELGKRSLGMASVAPAGSRRGNSSPQCTSTTETHAATNAAGTRSLARLQSRFRSSRARSTKGIAHTASSIRICRGPTRTASPTSPGHGTPGAARSPASSKTTTEPRPHTATDSVAMSPA
jgi:hypothetical protein